MSERTITQYFCDFCGKCVGNYVANIETWNRLISEGDEWNQTGSWDMCSDCEGKLNSVLNKLQRGSGKLTQLGVV